MSNFISQIAQPNGTITYGYDNANLGTSTAILGTGTWSCSFDAANRLTSTTNPNSETTSFTLGNAGRTGSFDSRRSAGFGVRRTVRREAP